MSNIIEADIDLRLFQVEKRDIDYLQSDIYLFQVEATNNNVDNLFIRYRVNDAIAIHEADFGRIIIDFLLGLKKILEITVYVRGELRLGIYYNSKNIPVFSLCLSDIAIKALSQYNLALESILYPCDQ